MVLLVKRPDRTAGLDPEQDYQEIYTNLLSYEFPWDSNQALSFALFRTYAVPSIGRLLFQTRAFIDHTQKRYDDTALLLAAPLEHGLDSPEGKTGLRRVNQMHHAYDIPNDDMRYVLSTFVVVPARWIADYGWRQLTDVELLASVRYYQALGRRMGIKDVPDTYDGFATLMDEYEAAHFAYDGGGRAVADSTLALLSEFYPKPVSWFMPLFSKALMDAPLLRAFGYSDPPTWIRNAAASGLRLRARFVALLPPRRKPVRTEDLKKIKSYPHGYDLASLGTFPHGTRAQAGMDRTESTSA